jgi:prepilin-type N-terminal cleavage/methylation domain-containing protein
MSTRPDSLERGFTLVELIVVIGILAILLALLVPASQKVLPKLDEIGCMQNLRQLWMAFAPCATEPTGWPQLPKGVKPGTIEEEKFWIDYSSRVLGVNKKTWLCPSIQRQMSHLPTNSQAPLIDYLPTLFDARPNTPNKWPSMPWFTEIGNVHGHGNLSVDRDGHVSPLTPVSH